MTAKSRMGVDLKGKHITLDQRESLPKIREESCSRRIPSVMGKRSIYPPQEAFASLSPSSSDLSDG